ncbi:MAG: hypothetical protein HYY08_00640 [Firmicutes bacterium]|nr:hypothetical protein [Bacillota bacterium]
MSRQEIVARVIVFTLLVLLPAGLLLYERTTGTDTLDLQARVVENGGWSPAVITLAAGRTTTMRIRAMDVMHGLRIDELGIDLPELEPGKVHIVRVTPEEELNFSFSCSTYCSPFHDEMGGRLEVSPR